MQDVIIILSVIVLLLLMMMRRNHSVVNYISIQEVFGKHPGFFSGTRRRKTRFLLPPPYRVKSNGKIAEYWGTTLSKPIITKWEQQQKWNWQFHYRENITNVKNSGVHSVCYHLPRVRTHLKNAATDFVAGEKKDESDLEIAGVLLLPPSSQMHLAPPIHVPCYLLRGGGRLGTQGGGEMAGCSTVRNLSPLYSRYQPWKSSDLKWKLLRKKKIRSFKICTAWKLLTVA